jgi:hypothetical protein
VNVASLQISAVLAAKTTLRDGQYGFCVRHLSEKALKGEECMVSNLLYLVCIAFTLRCVRGARSESGVLAGKEKSFYKVYSQNKVSHNLIHTPVFFFQVFEWNLNASSY